MANEREREEHDMSDMGLKRGERAKVAGPIGRVVRIVIGVLVLGSITGFYLNGSGQFVLRSAAVGAGLIVIYVLLHRLVATWPASCSRQLIALNSGSPMRAALPNSRLNPKVGRVMGHAGAARPAPVPPAGYPERWASRHFGIRY
jgi:hypothetical protein